MSFLDNIKSVPIIDFADRIGFTVTRKGRYFSLREHDSVIIDPEKNCFWRNSRFAKGFHGGAGSVIDFAIEFNGADDHKEAMRQIALMYNIEGDHDGGVAYSHTPATVSHKSTKPKREKGDVDYPDRGEDNKAVYRYLLTVRGIEQSVIRYFFAKRLLYQDTHKNCVFATPHFACVRGTSEKYRFVKDCEGNDYDECFFFCGNENADTLIVAEGVIDIMSIMSLFYQMKMRYNAYAYLALTGTNKIDSIFYHLKREPNISRVVLAFDNDKPDKDGVEAGLEAFKKVKDVLEKEYPAVSYKKFLPPKKDPEKKKDWNDVLKHRSSKKYNAKKGKGDR